MGTQVPKGFGTAFMLIGVPLILWSAMGTSSDLNKLDQQSSSREGRVNLCIERTTGLVHPGKQVEMCNCVVDEALKRGADERFGSYNEKALDSAINSCRWRLGI